MPGRLVGVVLAAYLSESRWLSVAVRALTRAATENFCGHYLVRFLRPRETSCIAASVDGCSTNTACLQHMQLGRFAGSVGQHVRERSGGLQSNSKAAKTGVSEFDPIVRGQENRSPPPSDFRAGWLAVCGRIDHDVGRVATANYCDLLLLATHARKTGALAVQTLLQGFTQKKSARYDRRRCA